MEKKHYQANVEIIREGTDGNHMYVLEKGAVTVTKGSGKETDYPLLINYFCNSLLLIDPTGDNLR